MQMKSPKIVEIPEWVRPVKVPEPEVVPHDQISGGVHYLLVDYQVLVPEDDSPSFYTHYADLITNQSGLDEESQINISFDPIYESVKLHHVVVKRDGKTIDKLKRARIAVLDYEDELDYQLYNGRKKINILLEDLRVGDRLEYSYTVSGRNPVYDGVFDAEFQLQWGVPVDTVSIGIYWQKKQMLFNRMINSDLSVKHIKGDRGSEFWVTASNVKPVDKEEDVPSWFDPYARVNFSESASWGSVAKWGSGLFEPAMNSAEAVTDIADDIAKQNADVSQRIVAALAYVQSNIRYVGIELGMNSHQASPAELTLARRYGDCKDKAALLVSFLRRMGIEAYPALVNTWAKGKIHDWLPSRSAFDHVIVAAYKDSKVYWIDPTRQFQSGSLDDIYQPLYGYALVLDGQSTKLASMESGTVKTGYFVSDLFDITAGESGEVLFNSRTEFMGLNAERQRNNLSRDGLGQISRNYLDFHNGYYDEIEPVSDLRFFEDDKKNRLVAEEQYRILRFWKKADKKGKYSGWIYSNAINYYLEEPEDKHREQDYKIAYPVNIQQEITILLGKEEWEFNEETVNIRNEFFDYDFQIRFNKADKKTKFALWVPESDRSCAHR